jgi:hypothetical protein
MPRYAYFTLRLQVPDETSAAPVSTGVVEDLTTGEKREFAGARELLAVLGVDGTAEKMRERDGEGQSHAGQPERHERA